MRRALMLLLLAPACGELVDDEPGGSESEVVDLGAIDVTTPDGGVFTGSATFDVPDDATGASIVVELPGGVDLVTVTALSRGDTPLTPLRVDPLEALCTAPYPASPEVDFGPGRHRITVAANGSHAGARLTGIFRRGGSVEGGVLDVNVHLAGVDVSEGDAALEALVGEYGRLLGKAGIDLGSVSYRQVSDGSLFDVTGPSSAPGTDLARLFTTSEATPGRALNLFLVRRLSQDGGMPLYGISGGVPGPGEITGTVHSGVVLNGEELEGPVDDRSAGPLLLGQVAAHETLHYLGLNHTTEREFDPGAEPEHDVIRDTPECTSAQDTSGDRRLSTSECQARDATNLMFWAGVDHARLPPGTDARVTSGQSHVVVRNPLVR